jgi:threonine/homoserine/homoserine lactone efflux protein
MPSWDTLLPFLLGVLILQLSPGPDMLLILNRGIDHGPRVAFSTIVGIVVIAGATQIGLLVLGLGALIQSYPAAMPMLQSLGALYLLYLGVRMMTTRLSANEQGKAHSVGASQALWEGTLSSLTNPKSFLFLFVFLPHFVDPASGPIWMQMLVLGCLHKLASLLTLSSIALAAGQIGAWTRRWPMLLSVQRNLCGVLMVMISLSLVRQVQTLL